MALALFPSALAQATPTLQLSYDTMLLEGQVVAAPTRAHLLVPGGQQAKLVSVFLEAADLVVNWTDVSSYKTSVGPAVQKGPASQGEYDHGAAKAEAEIRLPSANLLVSGPDGTAVLGSYSARATEVRSNPTKQWIAGAESGGFGSPDPKGTIVYFDLPAGAAQSRVAEATLRISGDLTLLVWDAFVNVTDSKSRTTYQSGVQGRSPAPDPIPVTEREARLLRIHAQDANLTVQMLIGEALWVSEQVTLDAAGRTVFSAAAGTIAGRAIADGEIRVEGALRVEARNASSEDARMRGFLRLREDAQVWDGDQPLAVQVETRQPEDSRVLLWAAAALIAVAGIVIRRLRPVRLKDVELAILGGRMGRAHRLARRLVRSRPTDADVVFLYGATLLHRHEYGRLIRRLEHLVEGLPGDETSGVAYLLSVAADALGDERRSRTWRLVASKDPLLASRIRADLARLGSAEGYS